MPAIASLSAASSRSGCSKCGIINSFGTRSCCAYGGAWFNNCGDDGDTQLDHTWTEGIQVCKNINKSSVETSIEVMLNNVTAIGHPGEQQNRSQQQANFYLHRSVSNAGMTDCKGRVGMARAAVWICVMLITLCTCRCTFFSLHMIT